MADRNLNSKTETALKTLIVLMGMYYILCYIFMVSKRLFYPFEIEWLEGYFVSAMIRFVEGRSLYTAPNNEFVPFLYPPLYYWVTGGLAKLFGAGFEVARLVSVFSSFVSGIIIYKFISRETKNGFISFVGVSLFFACYGLSDFWYDVARVDSLFLALTLLGLYILRYFSFTNAGVFLSALVLAMAYFTKQSALFFVIICSFYILHLKKSLFITFVVLSILFIAGGNIILNLQTDGWYWFYTFTVPLKHYGYKELVNDRVLGEIYSHYTHYAQQDYGSIKKLYYFFTNDLFENIPFLLLFIIGWILCWIKSPERKGSALFLKLALAASMLASISMRCKFGGHINGIIPAVSISIIFFCVIAGHIIKDTRSNTLFLYVLYISIVSQFIILKYNPFNHMPKPEDYKAGERVIETISSFKGDVYIPFHSNYQVMAGKKLFVHKMPIDDLYIGYKEKFPTALLEKISKKEFSAIIYDWDISPATGNPVEQAITKYYNKNTVIPYQNPYTFMPVSGLKVRPQIIYVPGKEE